MPFLQTLRRCYHPKLIKDQFSPAKITHIVGHDPWVSMSSSFILASPSQSVFDTFDILLHLLFGGFSGGDDTDYIITPLGTNAKNRFKNPDKQTYNHLI
ncbi:hypothetical protein M911_13885 [Ectothiorhodospira haloalkaliphila]|uniref:Uncharacterized protein n=1 Tax=Ectothiorhodospira haloalkaliphila TaxID=421628 RepID=W8KYZ2_9GAMM|nr:hypothetical protein M911_13885 [Ectothiorhodospira haloalkaliphila]